MNKKGRGAYRPVARTSSKAQQSWLGKGTSGGRHTLLVLAAIILLAFLLRSVFAYGPSIGNGFALSGGADAVYYERVIEYILATGQQLLIEPLHDYPHQATNLREPLYAWAVVMGGLFLSLFGIPIDTAVGMSFMFSTPVFGALSIIPVFLIAREAFGTRVGLIAAALMAISSAAISLTVLSDADHDAMAMFFILWSFYFLMRALEMVRGTAWVQSWKSGANIRYGVRSYLSENRVSLLLALMAGMCLAIAGMTWKGFVYALVIITIFLMVQLIIDRFSNRDSMGLTMVYAVMGFSTVLLCAPYYFGTNQVAGWWDLPLLIVLGGVFVGVYFTVLRDKPWTLTIPGLALISLAGIAILYAFFPLQYELLVSGAGYFGGRSKLYGTIAEAQAPSFSSLALSFGVTTIWLAIIGVFYSLAKIPKVKQPFYAFIVVWLLVAMIMASNAQRFVFNGSMAFAIAAAVTINIILTRVDLREYYHEVRSAEWRSKWRRALKPMPFFTVLFMAFLVVTPNVWIAVDTAIPNNTKADYDQQIYDGLPSFLRPDDYTYGDLRFLGSTGFRITTEQNWYYMDAWNWLSQQNNDLAERDRPAYLSWWDYGFEAGHYGKHPTVADNFQRGYNMAAAFITAQSESEAIALLIVRILETESFSDDVKATLQAHGVNAAGLEDRIHNPSAWVRTILNNPDVYGRYSQDLSAANARYIAASYLLTSTLNVNELASLYHDLRQDTGYDIGYFAIDTRLFPWSFRSMGIFSAPALLGDHVMDRYGLPEDFYTIYAILQNGQAVPLDLLTPNMRVTDYVLVYKDKLYESMMWRTFMGFNPADLGLTQQGIPGMAGSLADKESMQGWGLNHFRVVYRTAMYNPFTDYQNHPDAWRYISYDQGIELKAQISAGQATGVVDTSTSALRSGVVFIQYYDGVEITGTVTTEHGDPLEGVYVTVYDEYGIPHMKVQTGADGTYKVYAPFGDVQVKFSTGTYDKLYMRGANVLATNDYTFTYSQAMRAENAVVAASASHQVSADVVIPGSVITGTLKVDGEPMVGANVTFTADNINRTVVSDANGAYRIDGLVPSTGRLVIEYLGHEVSNQSVTLALAQTKALNVDIETATVTATLRTEDGRPARNVEVQLNDLDTSTTITARSDTNGRVVFDSLLPGRYSMSLVDNAFSFGQVEFRLIDGQEKSLDLNVRDAMTVSGKTRLSDNTPVGNAKVTFISADSSITVFSAANGDYSVTLPKGDWTVYAHGIHSGGEKAALFTINASQPSSMNIMLTNASVLRGNVNEQADLQLRSSTGAILNAVTSSTGAYRFAVPAGTYTLLAQADSKSWWQSVNVDGVTVRDITLTTGARITGTMFFDRDYSGTMNDGEEIANAAIRIEGTQGRILNIVSDADGRYDVTVPAGNYVLTASKSGYVTVEQDLVSVSGSVSNNVSMVPQNVTVSGVADASVTIQFVAVPGSGAVSKTVTGASYSVSLRPGEYDVVVDQNASGNDTVRYKHESSLTISVGSSPIVHDIALRTMIKTTVNTGQAADVIRITGLSGTLTGQTSYSVYLEEGAHTVHATRGNASAYLGAYDIDFFDRVITVTMSAASQVRGDVIYGVWYENAAGQVHVIDGAVDMPFTVSDGKWSALLPHGTYDIEFEFISTEQGRFYIYTHSDTITVSAAKVHDLVMERDHRNVTLSYDLMKNGAPVAASLTFTAMSPSAMDVTASGSSGSISIAPGVYTVYASSGADMFLGTLELTPFDDDAVTINLTEGINLVGQFRASGVGAPASATITDGDHTMPLPVAADGTFDIRLPAGFYSIDATASMNERTMAVDYSSTTGVPLNAGKSVTIDMARSDSRGASVTYNNALMSSAPGGTFTVSVTVTNNGNVNETVTLSSNSWPMSFSDNSFTLPFGTNNTRTVTATVTVPSNAAVEHADVRVIARGADNASLGSLTLNTAVGAQPLASLSYTGPKGVSGQSYEYNVLINNSGNTRENYVFAVNSAALAAQGWNVTLHDSSGNAMTSKELAAFAQATVVVRLTPIANMTQAAPVVTLTATSASNSEVVTFTGALPDVVLSTDQVQVGGRNVFSDGGSISNTTWALLVLSVTSITLFILMGMSRGVFSRRKR